jgi:hypothetical protein
MLLLSKLFGVTTCDAERYLDAEEAYAEEIVVLKMQADAATKQHPAALPRHSRERCLLLRRA